MNNKSQLVTPRAPRETALPALDLVIPVTTPDLTRAAIRAAERLAFDLYAEARLLRIQIVPFPLQLAAPPVPLEFLREQLAHYESTLPMKREIRLARELDAALIAALRPDSVVMLASKRRPWRTRQQSLAAMLRRAGYKVILTFEGENHA